MHKPHAIWGSHGREMCVATGPGAGLFGPRLRCIEWKTLFCRKQSLAEFLGLDHLEKSHFRFPSALAHTTSYCTKGTPLCILQVI